MNNTIAIIQARMSSSRLPGKVMANLGGKPMLWHVIDRARKAQTLDQVVVATTVNETDDGVVTLCEAAGIPFFRGSEDDVLARYYEAARYFDAGVVVRLTGDCPLLDWTVIDQVVNTFHAGDFDYVSNTLQCTYPDGLDTEVVLFSGLERAWREARLQSEREHVTAYIYKHPELFRLHNVQHTEDLSALRWTVDEPEDLVFVRAIYDHFGSASFGMVDVIEYLQKHPELKDTNARYERNEGYQKSLREDVMISPEHKTRSKGTGQVLYEHAKNRIPGGTQLLSKRPEMFLPDQWPSYYSRAQGIDVWDLDGNRYIDTSNCSVGACVLGYADPDINAAVCAAVENGVMSTLNCREEVDLADLLCELHPWANMVRYARSGGEAMTVAVRIARACTGRDKIVFSGYHGWHDWYLAANLASDTALDGHLLPGLSPRGVPRGLQGTALPFRYGHLHELKEVVQRNQKQVAAIVMEPLRSTPPEPGFLEAVRQIADEIGALLVFDEITAGFRLTNGGAHLLFGVMPDMAVFAKAISSGHPMGAIIGRERVMQAAQETFISSTHWTERIGPVASLATLRKFVHLDVSRHLIATGERIQEGWRQAAQEARIQIDVGGMAPLSHFSFEYPNGQTIRTVFTQKMLDRGYLAAPSFYVMYAHKDSDVDTYLNVVYEVFHEIAQAIKTNNVEAQLHGPVAHAGFQRLTD